MISKWSTKFQYALIYFIVVISSLYVVGVNQSSTEVHIFESSAKYKVLQVKVLFNISNKGKVNGLQVLNHEGKDKVLIETINKKIIKEFYNDTKECFKDLTNREDNFVHGPSLVPPLSYNHNDKTVTIVILNEPAFDILKVSKDYGCSVQLRYTAMKETQIIPVKSTTTTMQSILPSKDSIQNIPGYHIKAGYVWMALFVIFLVLLVLSVIFNAYSYWCKTEKVLEPESNDLQSQEVNKNLLPGDKKDQGNDDMDDGINDNVGDDINDSLNVGIPIQESTSSIGKTFRIPIV